MNEPSPAKYLLFKNKILQNEKGKKIQARRKKTNSETSMVDE